MTCAILTVPVPVSCACLCLPTDHSSEGPTSAHITFEVKYRSRKDPNSQGREVSVVSERSAFVKEDGWWLYRGVDE